jgi:perosamine synthetase
MARYLPPSGVPIRLSDIICGLCASFGDRALERFKRDLRDYFSVRHVYLTSSGRAGLSMIFQALHRLQPERDEVILPAFTSFSVPSAVVNAGLKVALYDLDGETLSPDLKSLRQAVSGRTLCIVACHLYGYPCDMDAVLALAREKGVPIVDDAAQAMGASYRGRLVGTLGYAGLYSLSRGKNISAVDGGIVVTDSPELAGELEKLQLAPVGVLGGAVLAAKALILSLLLHPLLYGVPARLPFLNIGASFFEPEFLLQRFTSFQAAIGSRMLVRLKGINNQRRAKAALFISGLGEQFRSPEIVDGAEPVFLRLPILPGAVRLTAAPELGVVASYPAPLQELRALKPHLVVERTFDTAKALASGIVTLPTHGFVAPRDQSTILARTLTQRSGQGKP